MIPKIQSDIFVYAEYDWTCQHCFETVRGFASAEAAAIDSNDHECEDYT